MDKENISLENKKDLFISSTSVPEKTLFTTTPLTILYETKVNSSKETSSLKDPNFLESLMKGNFNNIDWINVILGSESGKKTLDASEGNALAQIFSNNKNFSEEIIGGNMMRFFGSGLDDDANLKTEKNFH